MADRSAVDRQRRAQASVRRLAQRDLRAFFESLDLSRPEAARDALLQFVPTLTDRYGNVAATLAADYFDELRADAKVPGMFRATLAPTAPVDQAQGSVRYAAGNLFTDDPAGALPLLAQAVGRFVLAPGRQTFADATGADPAHPRWARVPAGAQTCAFCVMLASRGFVYRSEKSADVRSRDQDRYHSDCDCTAVADWSDDPVLEGYDPDALYAMYSQARAANGDDVFDTSGILAQMREMHGLS